MNSQSIHSRTIRSLSLCDRSLCCACSELGMRFRFFWWSRCCSCWRCVLKFSWTRRKELRAAVAAAAAHEMKKEKSEINQCSVCVWPGSCTHTSWMSCWEIFFDVWMQSELQRFYCTRIKWKCFYITSPYYYGTLFTKESVLRVSCPKPSHYITETLDELFVHIWNTTATATAVGNTTLT